MSPLAIVIIALISAGVGYLVGNHIGYDVGRDTQRVKDILELWKTMPERDNRGRYKTKRSST